MTMRGFLLLGLVLLGAMPLANCSGRSNANDDEGCREGTERCACRSTPGDECESGLACRSRICVEAGGNTGGGGGEPACGTGQTSCGGDCVLLASDDAHCGDCNTSCPAGTSCVAGDCACPGGRTLCDGVCVNLQTDGSNCGLCGIDCAGNSVCVDAVCTCPAGRSACNGTCVDLATDPAHCGECALACADAEVCSEASCADSCADGLTQCGQSCVDIQSSRDHCGLCDNTCATGFACDDGSCACPESETACGGECTDTETDAANCGGCGNQCLPGQSCEDANCACPDGRTLCGDDCVDTDGSPQHCGACGVACDTGADCVNGTCEGGGSGGNGGAGSGGSSGNGGSGGASGGMSGSGGSGGTGTSGTPSVVLLIDGSSSMFEPRTSYWDPAYEALMDPDDGALSTYADRIRFGVAVFQGSTTPSTEANPACATISSSSIALDNRAAIDTVYDGVGDAFTVGQKYETPTGHAVNRVATTLAAYSADPPGPKYIVLVTDGNPNTCQVLDPQCGQDVSVKAVQDARAAGIRTLVLGMGVVLGVDGGCPSTANCGTAHLQDLANAGLGMGVGPPPDNYQFLSCIATEGGLKATYTAAGNAPYYTGTTMAELRAEMTEIFERIVMRAVP